MSRSNWIGLIVTITSVLAGEGRADLSYQYGFTGISPESSAADIAVGEAQLTVEVREGPTSGSALFTFRNIGDGACSITDIYFEDSVLSAVDGGLLKSSGVDFKVNKKPGNLPAGNALDPDFDEWVSLSSKSPNVPKNGVNQDDEWLTAKFKLDAGETFSDVIDAIVSGDLRIGLHVQAFADGGSASFVNIPHAPLPGAVILGGLGLGVAAHRLRRRKA